MACACELGICATSECPTCGPIGYGLGADWSAWSSGWRPLAAPAPCVACGEGSGMEAPGGWPACYPTCDALRAAREERALLRHVEQLPDPDPLPEWDPRRTLDMDEGRSDEH